MITLSPQAVQQIKSQIEESNDQGLFLRIAAKVKTDESIEYGMGFDEEKEGDVQVNQDDIKIIIAPSSAEHLNGAHLDFVELEGGAYSFIFQNPNDPSYKPPAETEKKDD